MVVKKTFNPALDLIRTVAIVFVISQHFMLNTHFFQEQNDGVSLFIQRCLLPLFSIATPLFMILTGYLNTTKEINRKYYRGFAKIAFSIFFFVLIWIGFRLWVLKEYFNILKLFADVTSLNIIRYSWYIKMYIGLFLLMPFLNVLWKNIEKKEKELLICSLAIITFIPSWVNRGNLEIIPSYWSVCYPIAYYYIGSYLKEYTVRINPNLHLVILCIFITNGLVNSLLANGYFSLYGGPDSIFTMIIAVFIFQALNRFDHCCPIKI